jgi:general L-amino acid transport system substrate-binding protein
VAQAASGDQRPEAQRLLGKTGDLGKALGLDNAWAVNIIKAVGNYGEVFQRNLVPIGIQRARNPNAQYTQGGLQYSPPFR